MINRLFKIAQQNKEGFTMNIFTFETPTSGYVVAVKETQNSFGLMGLKKVVNHAKKNGGYVGGWFNVENGKYYFDSVFIIENRKEALKLGKLNKQIAIFSLNNFQTIRV